MLRRMSFFVCVVAAASLTTGMLQADTLAWDGPRVGFDTSNGTDSFTLSSSLTDWWLGSGNVKAGGTAFSTVNMPFTPSLPNYPTFAYANGTSPASATNERGTYAHGYGFQLPVAPTLNIAVPGSSSGQVALWVASGSAYGDYVTVKLGAQTINAGTNSPEYVDAGNWIYTLGYSNTSSSAQTMTVTLQAFDGYNNAGFFAGTLNVVPEPSALILLASGLIGLLCYAWRKRK